jgi:hypothetical protein
LTPQNNPWPSGVKKVFVQLEGRISNGKKITKDCVASKRDPVLSQDTGQDKDRPKARDKDRGSLSRPSSPSLGVNKSTLLHVDLPAEASATC